MKMVSVYESFAQQFPDDTLSPEFLFRAADLAQGVGHDQMALQFYRTLRDSFPDYRKRAAVLFMMGFVYQNNLGDTSHARESYTEFLENTPSIRWRHRRRAR